MTEQVDVIVVGARCAGSAAAIALARAGRKVVALDRSTFPSDTLSTHLLFPAGLAELQALGALDRVRALGAPELPSALVGGAGYAGVADFSPVDGIDHGMCVKRTGLDAALVETAREAGAEVREGVKVTEVLGRFGRVKGVRLADGSELRAPLVIGADGRRSLVARAVGADEPHRSNPNGRACYFAYWDDPAGGMWRSIAPQWRDGGELATAFPCDDGQVLVLLMPPVERIPDFKGNLLEEYERTVASMPALAERLVGATRATKVRSATDTTSYFRRSSGPGWALAGDAGHFKDPVTAQGIRDALRFGRLLGEAAAPVLHERDALDRALVQWERRRDRECIETYQWTNRLGRGEAMTELEIELYRHMSQDAGQSQKLLDVFSRIRRPARALTPARAAWTATRAFARRGTDRRNLLWAVRRELGDGWTEWVARERALRRPLPSLARQVERDEPVGGERRGVGAPVGVGVGSGDRVERVVLGGEAHAGDGGERGE